MATASCRSERRRPSAMMISEVKVMIPSPLSWIIASRSACPAGVKWVAVSTTISPVTQMALVAVKRASSHPSSSPA